MSCSSATSPIDITKQGSAGSCHNLCRFIFDYPSSNCVVTNNETYLGVPYDTALQEYAKFNGNSQTVDEIRIYSPSLHTFNGKQADAEIVVTHSSIQGPGLIVCVPVMKAAKAGSESASLLKNIIDGTAMNAPNTSDTSVITTTGFNLNKLIPKTNFYYYSGTLPYDPCNGSYHVVVYEPNQFTSINVSSLQKLRNILTAHSITTKIGTSYYLSGKSASSSESSDVYMQCVPVTDSDDTEGFQMLQPNEPAVENMMKLFATGVVGVALFAIAYRFAIRRK